MRPPQRGARGRCRRQRDDVKRKKSQNLQPFVRLHKVRIEIWIVGVLVMPQMKPPEKWMWDEDKRH